MIIFPDICQSMGWTAWGRIVPTQAASWPGMQDITYQQKNKTDQGGGDKNENKFTQMSD